MNYYGGNERSSSGSSSRKGKKSGSDKPKQPQRGLGVAQLEKIRLHSQMAGFLPQEDIRMQTPYSSSSSSFSYNSPSTAASFNSFQGTHHSHMLGMSELDRTNYAFGESHIASINPRWDASSAILEAQRYVEPIGISSRHLFSPELLEDSLRSKKTRKDRDDSMGSNSQNSDSNGSHELDLELRLAL
uniref:protein SPEAR3-like isoform X2 n=1 Tax=Erigeron canadensis TaxID=72917 RepID=UPI001CB8BD51|nr:protein SPEAR3-like isoform X2 [Erigeron canadensis]